MISWIDKISLIVWLHDGHTLPNELSMLVSYLPTFWRTRSLSAIFEMKLCKQSFDIIVRQKRFVLFFIDNFGQFFEGAVSFRWNVVGPAWNEGSCKNQHDDWNILISHFYPGFFWEKKIKLRVCKMFVNAHCLMLSKTSLSSPTIQTPSSSRFKVVTTETSWMWLVKTPRFQCCLPACVCVVSCTSSQSCLIKYFFANNRMIRNNRRVQIMDCDGRWKVNEMCS